FAVVVENAAAAFLLRIGGWDGGVFQHRLEGFRVVNAGKAFYKGIGDNHVGVAATLCATVIVSAAGVRHISGMAIDIDERADEIASFIRADEGYGNLSLNNLDSVRVEVEDSTDLLLLALDCDLFRW